MPEISPRRSSGWATPAARTGHRKTLYLLQLLRAVAALMVVAHHASILVEERLHLRPTIWLQGASGVDIFFVLSGLVMTLSTDSLPLGGREGALKFLKRRAERIVPLYWIMTSAKLLGILLIPSLAVNAVGSVWHVLASYLFLPSFGPTRTLEPLLIVGWTLNLEALFYVLFATALWLKVRSWVILLPSLAGLAALRWIPSPLPPILFALSDPVVLDFLYGLVLGNLLLRRVVAGQAVSVVLVLCGMGALELTPWGLSSAFRPLVWGLPAAAIVAGALGLESTFGDRLPRVALQLGDASYSIYLTHGFVLPILGVVVAAAQLTRAWSVVITLLAALVLSSVLGWLTFRTLELPLLRWFRLRGLSADPAISS